MTYTILNTATDQTGSFMHDASRPWIVIARDRKSERVIGRYGEKAQASRRMRELGKLGQFTEVEGKLFVDAGDGTRRQFEPTLIPHHKSCASHKGYECDCFERSGDLGEIA